mmetsp:Transcript_129173/g.306540  ORF Transcript_129173/g.306540 Transcript_129173/m.306540 type:complete len:217 (-) Transcript_129173:55-705(-)
MLVQPGTLSPGVGGWIAGVIVGLTAEDTDFHAPHSALLVLRSEPGGMCHGCCIHLLLLAAALTVELFAGGAEEALVVVLLVTVEHGSETASRPRQLPLLRRTDGRVLRGDHGRGNGFAFAPIIPTPRVPEVCAVCGGLLVKAILGQGIGGPWWHPADAREDVVPLPDVGQIRLIGTRRLLLDAGVGTEGSGGLASVLEPVVIQDFQVVHARRHRSC